jgi:hypothetical protein
MQPTDRKRRSDPIKSALIAGFVALVIYFVTTMLLAEYSRDVLLMSGLIGASTFATAWFVTTRLEQRKRDR